MIRVCGYARPDNVGHHDITHHHITHHPRQRQIHLRKGEWANRFHASPGALEDRRWEVSQSHRHRLRNLQRRCPAALPPLPRPISRRLVVLEAAVLVRPDREGQRHRPPGGRGWALEGRPAVPGEGQQEPPAGAGGPLAAPQGEGPGHVQVRRPGPDPRRRGGRGERVHVQPPRGPVQEAPGRGARGGRGGRHPRRRPERADPGHVRAPLCRGGRGARRGEPDERPEGQESHRSRSVRRGREEGARLRRGMGR